MPCGTKSRRRSPRGHAHVFAHVGFDPRLIEEDQPLGIKRFRNATMRPAGRDVSRFCSAA